MNDLEARKKEIIDSVLNIGSLLTGKKITYEDAYNRFRNMDLSKQVVVHGNRSDIDGDKICGNNSNHNRHVFTKKRI